MSELEWGGPQRSLFMHLGKKRRWIFFMKDWITDYGLFLDQIQIPVPNKAFCRNNAWLLEILQMSQNLSAQFFCPSQNRLHWGSVVREHGLSFMVEITSLATDSWIGYVLWIDSLFIYAWSSLKVIHNPTLSQLDKSVLKMKIKGILGSSLWGQSFSKARFLMSLIKEELHKTKMNNDQVGSGQCPWTMHTISQGPRRHRKSSEVIWN